MVVQNLSIYRSIVFCAMSIIAGSANVANAYKADSSRYALIYASSILPNESNESRIIVGPKWKQSPSKKYIQIEGIKSGLDEFYVSLSCRIRPNGSLKNCKVDSMDPRMPIINKIGIDLSKKMTLNMENLEYEKLYDHIALVHFRLLNTRAGRHPVPCLPPICVF